MEILPSININMRMPTGATTPQETPLVIQRATQTKKLPLAQFGGDIVLLAGTDTTIDVAQVMGRKCVGFLMLNVIGTIRYSINGGALRTTNADFVLDDADVQILRIMPAGGSSCIVQLNGV